MSEVNVLIDNRVRLVTAVLAASDWPDYEQQQQTHAVHPQAKLTRQYVSDHTDHPAVQSFNDALGQEDFQLNNWFALAVRSMWPTFDPVESPPSGIDLAWAAQLADFYTDTAIAAFFWADHEEVWQEAVDDLQAIFHGPTFHEFLGKLQTQAFTKKVIVVPNLIYPSLQTIVLETEKQYYLILPPPPAFGESPPWPYGEDAGWVIAVSCRHLLNHLLADTLANMTPEQQETLKHAAAVICLEEILDDAESLAYLVRSKKQYNLPFLPVAVENLRGYLTDPSSKSLIEQIPS